VRTLSWRFAFATLLTYSAFAQTYTGSITGTVLDQSNATIPDATVAATNLATNVSQSTRSTSSGSYTIPALPPGTYRVSVEAGGFQKLNREPITVEASRVVTLDLPLTVGQAATQVTITGEAPIIQESNSVVQYTISQREIRELPLPNQNVLYALNTIPGVVGVATPGTPSSELAAWHQSFVTPGSSISVSGGRQGSTQFQADGINNNGLFFGRIGLNFSSDTIQEMTVHQNSFSAEYGRTGGGIVNMVTRSGTNELHGTLFSFTQNDKLNAAPYNRTITKPLSRSWRGGLNLGGPLVIPNVYDGRNKSFFFGTYEPLRQRSNNIFRVRVPTEREWEGDFSQTLYDTGSNNYPVTIFRQYEFNPDGTLSNRRIVPASGEAFPVWEGAQIPRRYISPIAAKLRQFYPTPNIPLTVNGQNYESFHTINNVNDRWMIKFDQVITAENRLTFRYATDDSTGMRTWFGTAGSPLTSDTNVGTNILLTDTHSFAGAKVNEFRIGYLRVKTYRVQPPEATERNWMAELGLPSNAAFGFPRINVGNMEGLGAGGPWGETDNTFQLNDHLSWFVGRHSIKLGFEFNAPQQNYTNWQNVRGNWSFDQAMTNIGTGVNTASFPGINRPGARTGFGMASLLLGFPSGVSITALPQDYQYRWKYYAAFLQDDIKVNPNLTLNLGFRYQVEVPRSEKHHNQGTFVDRPATTSDGIPVQGYVQLSGLGGYRSTLFPTRYNNWEPRVGFAYRLPHKRWTPAVVRAAYGISHVPTSGLFREPTPDLTPRTASLASQGGRDGGWVQIDNNKAVLPDRLPEWPQDGKFADVLKINNVVVLPDRVDIPYMQQWNLFLGYELAGNMGLQIGYVGSKGTNLFGQSSRTNLQDEALYRQAFLEGVDLGRQIPNPFGARDVNGNVANIPFGNTLRANSLLGPILNPLAQGYNSNYNALQVDLRKRFSHGFQFSVNYTWSKSIDDSSCEGQFCNNNISDFGTGFAQLYNGDRRLERSVSINDIPHNFRYNFNWDLPFGKGKAFASGAKGFVNQLIGGWKIGGVGAVQSGQPWQLRLGPSNGLPGEYGNFRPNIVAGVDPYNPDWKASNGSQLVSRYLNVEQLFAPPARFELGNAPRTLSNIRYPGVETFDVSFIKEFPIDEQRRFEFRAELFSAFNHVNFYGNNNNFQVYNSLDYRNFVNPPATDFNQRYSSTVDNTGPNRVIQLGLKLYF
jgi:hypothetical protein